LAPSDRRTDMQLYWRLVRDARSYWPHIAALLAVDLLATPIALLAPVPLKVAVDSVIGTDPLPGFLNPIVPGFLGGSQQGLLAFAAALLVVIALISHLRSLGSSVLRTYAGEKLVLAFRGRLFRHAQRLSLTYHDSAGTADSIYRIQYDASAIQNVAVEGVIPFITAGFTLAGMVYVTARLDWTLAAVALSVSPVLVILTAVYRRRLRTQWRQVKKLESRALRVIQESLTSLRVVKAFGQEDREQERFLDRYGEGVSARIRVLLADGAFSMAVGLTIAAGTAAILYLGVRHVLAGVLTLGTLLLIMAYVAQLYGPLRTIGSKVTSLQRGLAAAERAYGLLDHAPDVRELTDARAVDRAIGAISFSSVTFAYEPGYTVVEDLTFDVPVGARVGVAGRTGAGKSTIMGLLTRFFDPTVGSILLDGVDLRDYKLRDLRNQYAIVLQDTVLFSTSVAENIAYAKPEATPAEIESAAVAANAHEFILDLPDGYGTLVGERGMRLSGGERQRIALARAFVKDAPILILDEPTSSVDMGTEAAIIDAMERLMKGRTTFMVAHRLSTLENCDVLLIIEEGTGRLITDGVNKELAKARGSLDRNSTMSAGADGA